MLSVYPGPSLNNLNASRWRSPMLNGAGGLRTALLPFTLITVPSLPTHALIIVLASASTSILGFSYWAENTSVFFSNCAAIVQYGSGTCNLISSSRSTANASAGPCTLPIDRLRYLLAVLRDLASALERLTP